MRIEKSGFRFEAVYVTRLKIYFFLYCQMKTDFFSVL